MATSRAVFYDTINNIRGLALDPLLTDVFPPSANHNTKARMLRCGLVVSSFSLLETYIEERLEEKIGELPNSKITYSMLSDKLREMFAIDAVVGLNNRLNFVEKSNRLKYVETQLPRLAAVLSTPPVYTGMGFSPKGSNTSAADIGGLLSAFGIDEPWRTLSRLSQSVGASRVSLHDDFVNFSHIRNAAAHDSATNVPTADLQTHFETALLVGMCFDLALSNAIDCFVREPTLTAALAGAKSLSLKFRFLDEDSSGQWREKVGTNGRVIKRYSNLPAARAGARSRTGPPLIVARDQRLTPCELL